MDKIDSKFNIGDLINWKRTEYEIKDIFQLATTKKIYYTIKEVCFYAGYRTILLAELEKDGILTHKNWNYDNSKVCTCGAHTVYGKNCNPECHADYCELDKSTYGLGFNF